MNPGPAGLNDLEQVVGNVISVVVGMGFIALLIMIVVAGFKYLTSAGEPKAVLSAHQTLTWALLGVVFMAVAWVILKLIEVFTGIPVTVFNIRSLCGTGGIQFCSPIPTPVIGP